MSYYAAISIWAYVMWVDYLATLGWLLPSGTLK